MKKPTVLGQYNLKILFLRILVHALALSLTVLILPSIYFLDLSLGTVLFATLVLGVLNALVKPILELLTFRLLFVTYGLVLVAINTLILYLLAFFLPGRFVVDSLFWAFVGGLLIGIFGNFLENLFGITLPILPDEARELRKQIEEQDVSLLEAWINERKAARRAEHAGERAELLPEAEITAGPVIPAGTGAAVEAEAPEGAVEPVDLDETSPNERAAVTGGES
jgi:putative membrane protein